MVKIVKNKISNLLLLVSFMMILDSCKKADQIPTPQNFKDVTNAALAGMKKTVQFNAEDGFTFVSDKGAELIIAPNHLKLNNILVTGAVDLEFVEIFDRWGMLVANKHTLGLMPDGNKSLLISAGEFYINITKGGQPLTPTAGMPFFVPVNPSTAGVSDMELFDGVDSSNNLTWKKDAVDSITIKGHQFPGTTVFINTYTSVVSNFGWTNIDRFYNDPRPKTTMLVSVPAGYDPANCTIAISYDGEPNALARLDTYDNLTKLFTEHYGQIPIGLACHIIFLTEEAGQFRYAIKGVTITANTTYTFSLSETSIATAAGLIPIINALP